ncbi:hypothetical protein [Candidatus Albibeggiatoa sp. nov. NOAA]|uniref:hypothetical protein n=1 Tax=Candidatus Albibeggiatoa sp. nov. NOAA TaxID=3162724 RepID=UPI0032F1B33B|nr:hypothetical protein [Thiotrichaceae bacterium]
MMNSAFMLFLGLVTIFVFTIASFIKKNQQLRQSQIAREQAFLSAMAQKKGQPPS